jgi:general stress protein YciG
MAENRNQQHTPKPESASKPGKQAYEERERDRASQIDQSHQDNARGDRNPGNFQNDRERASEAGRKGGQR